MHKQTLHHVWRYLRHVHPWYFLILAVLFAVISVKALQHNNLEMMRRREVVFQADKTGGDVEGSLKSLREYVYAHMNTNLSSGTNAVHPPIQLRYTYERLQAAQQQALGQNNSALYGQAQQTCNEQGENATAQMTISCIQSYMAARGVQLADVPDALYKFDFISAKWSPDLAGWSIVATVLSFAAFAVSGMYRLLMKRYL